MENCRGFFDMLCSGTRNCLYDKPFVSSRIQGWDCEAISILRKVYRYFFKQIEESAHFRKSNVLQNILSTVEASFILLANLLLTMPRGRYVSLTRFSTDQLEALFSAVRQMCGGANNPSLYVMERRVEAVFKTRMMNILMNIAKKNINIGEEQFIQAIKGLNGRAEI